ncbi:MAG: STAS domain-containing protein [Solidesulfovibrio sp. DCME]|uniref:STAS domain-containing protein n=1 Tax=Solidesulfovibrio sp. DCME TaxID=3447380 RepID=UPI003D1375F3
MQRLSLRRTDQEMILVLSGEIVMDMVLERKAEVARLVEEYDGPAITLDLAEVTFMDSSGVGLLIGLRRQCQERGKRFAVVNPAPPIRKLFETLRLTDYFAVPQTPADRPAP